MNQVNVSCHIVKKKITNIKYKLDKAKYNVVTNQDI